MIWIGQPAYQLPTGAMLVYGRVSETERVWVIDDGVNNLKWLKIQSIPIGKLMGIRVLTATKQLLTCFDYCLIFVC